MRVLRGLLSGTPGYRNGDRLAEAGACSQVTRGGKRCGSPGDLLPAYPCRQQAKRQSDTANQQLFHWISSSLTFGVLILPESGAESLGSARFSGWSPRNNAGGPRAVGGAIRVLFALSSVVVLSARFLVWGNDFSHPREFNYLACRAALRTSARDSLNYRPHPSDFSGLAVRSGPVPPDGYSYEAPPDQRIWT